MANNTYALEVQIADLLASSAWLTSTLVEAESAETALKVVWSANTYGQWGKDVKLDSKFYSEKEEMEDFSFLPSVGATNWLRLIEVIWRLLMMNGL